MIKFENVTKIYPGMSSPAVDNLSFTVPTGEICTIVGPSGCGKTTAMKLVNRLIDATDGAIHVLDERDEMSNVLEMDPKQKSSYDHTQGYNDKRQQITLL